MPSATFLSGLTVSYQAFSLHIVNIGRRNGRPHSRSQRVPSYCCRDAS